MITPNEALCVEAKFCQIQSHASTKCGTFTYMPQFAVVYQLYTTAQRFSQCDIYIAMLTIYGVTSHIP